MCHQVMTEKYDSPLLKSSKNYNPLFSKAYKIVNFPKLFAAIPCDNF